MEVFKNRQTPVRAGLDLLVPATAWGDGLDNLLRSHPAPHCCDSMCTQPHTFAYKQQHTNRICNTPHRADTHSAFFAHYLRIKTYTLTLAHACRQTQSRTYMYSPVNAHTITHTYPHRETHTEIKTDKHRVAHTHTHTHNRAQAHNRTHTQRQTLTCTQAGTRTSVQTHTLREQGSSPPVGGHTHTHTLTCSHQQQCDAQLLHAGGGFWLREGPCVPRGWRGRKGNHYQRTGP